MGVIGYFRALAFFGFIRVDLVQSDESSAWSGSFGFVGFIQTHPAGRRVH